MARRMREDLRSRRAIAAWLGGTRNDAWWQGTDRWRERHGKHGPRQGDDQRGGGGVRRDLGEWTGDTNMQMEGLTQEVKGKAQKTWGDVKDAVRDARNEVKRKPAGRKAGDSRAE